MNIIFFAHPLFLTHQSMPRFAQMLAHGMKERGHEVETWYPEAALSRLAVSGGLKKWLGYADQYIIFPEQVRRRLKRCPADTLFVFTDHALGPWLHLLTSRFHVMHCHDFLAQRSALGQVPENPTRFSGSQYQAFIRRGYSRGKNFISVSEKTKEDLHQFLPSAPVLSEVVYNGLNQAFGPGDPDYARIELGKIGDIDINSGFILHVGSNHWYKNRKGVVEIYDSWRKLCEKSLPLLMIGENPTAELLQQKRSSPFAEDIHFLSGIEDKVVHLAYQGATVFLFPSLAEGFGWPIAEAMASGCPVITTDEAPMTEVAGEAGFLIPRKPLNETEVSDWADKAAAVVERVVNLNLSERDVAVQAGISNAMRFDAKVALDRIEQIYKSILEARQA